MPRQATYEYFNCGIEIADAEVTKEDGTKEQGKVVIIHDPAEPARHIIPLDTAGQQRMISGLTGGIIPASAADIRALPRMDVPKGN